MKVAQPSGHFPRMNYMRLLKVLYIAERESLGETGHPILGATIYAMERGPVMDEIYALMKGQSFHAPEFQKYFVRDHYAIAMIDDPGNGDLTEYEIAKIQEVEERYADRDEWDMVNICHELQEWKKNDPGKSCKTIPLRDILDAVGISGDEADLLIADAKSQQDADLALRAVQSDRTRK